jgi:hypothetical protein
MNFGSVFLWGFSATVVLTVVMIAGNVFGYTRMDFPLLMGTLLVPGRDRSRRVGFLLHFLQGMAVAWIYCAIFESWRVATWWAGSIIGFIHGAFLLLAGMSLLPAIHPRMANEEHGPTPTKQLEPPGFMALNYGRRTPHVVLVAHTIYGAILGAFYHLS